MLTLQVQVPLTLWPGGAHRFVHKEKAVKFVEKRWQKEFTCGANQNNHEKQGKGGKGRIGVGGMRFIESWFP